MSTLDIQMEEHGDVLSIALAGSLDTDTADSFDEALTARLEAGWHKVVVDVEQLEYISSAGIGVLVGSVNQLQESNGDMYLVKVPPKIEQVLDMLCLMELFSVFDDRNSAIAAYQ